jgi:flagellar assembly protein FliH
MASAAAKFLFDEDFATGEKPTITTVEADRRRKDAEAVAYRNGFAAAQAQAHAEAAQRMAATLDRIGETMERLSRGLYGVEARLEIEAVEVAVAVARKLAPELIAAQPFAEIEALATECFRQLVAAPHITVQLPEDIYSAVKDKLEDLAQARGFQGRLAVLADADLKAGDCRIEWADGGVNRDVAAADAAIGEIVTRYVAARTAEVN